MTCERQHLDMHVVTTRHFNVSPTWWLSMVLVACWWLDSIGFFSVLVRGMQTRFFASGSCVYGADYGEGRMR